MESTKFEVAIYHRDINHTQLLSFGTGPEAKRAAESFMQEQRDSSDRAAWGRATESYRLIAVERSGA